MLDELTALKDRIDEVAGKLAIVTERQNQQIETVESHEAAINGTRQVPGVLTQLALIADRMDPQYEERIDELNSKVSELEGYKMRREWYNKIFIVALVTAVVGAGVTYAVNALSGDEKAPEVFDNGRARVLSDEAAQWALEAKAAKTEAKLADERAEELEDKIKAEIGQYSYGVLPDGTVISYKTQVRGSYRVKPSSFRVMRVLKKLPDGVQIE